MGRKAGVPLVLHRPRRLRPATGTGLPRSLGNRPVSHETRRLWANHKDYGRVSLAYCSRDRRAVAGQFTFTLEENHVSDLPDWISDDLLLAVYSLRGGRTRCPRLRH